MLETAWESRWLPDLKWGCSSVGRAPALQAGGQEFESLHLHSSIMNARPIVLWKPNIESKIFKYLIEDMTRHPRLNRKIQKQTTNKPTNVTTLGDADEVSREAVIHRPTVYFISFASQMIHQIYNNFLTSELVRSNWKSDDRSLSYWLS